MKYTIKDLMLSLVDSEKEKVLYRIEKYINGQYKYNIGPGKGRKNTFIGAVRWMHNHVGICNIHYINPESSVFFSYIVNNTHFTYIIVPIKD